MNNFTAQQEDEEIDKTLWGELESESEEEESEESESDEEKEPETADATGLITPADGGLITPSGVTSVPVGMETPDMIELRKKRIEDAMDQGGDTPALYQVLKEKTAAVGGAMMGSAHVYDIQVGKIMLHRLFRVKSKMILQLWLMIFNLRVWMSVGCCWLQAATGKRAGEAAEGVEVALNPDELDLDTAAIQAKYDQQMRESQLEKEDLSDMVADHAAKQAKVRRHAGQIVLA